MTMFGKTIMLIMVMVLTFIITYGTFSVFYKHGWQHGYIQSQQDATQGKPARWILTFRDGKTVWVENK